MNNTASQWSAMGTSHRLVDSCNNQGRRSREPFRNPQRPPHCLEIPNPHVSSLLLPPALSHPPNLQNSVTQCIHRPSQIATASVGLSILNVIFYGRADGKYLSPIPESGDSCLTRITQILQAVSECSVQAL